MPFGGPVGFGGKATPLGHRDTQCLDGPAGKQQIQCLYVHEPGKAQLPRFQEAQMPVIVLAATVGAVVDDPCSSESLTMVALCITVRAY